MIASTVGDVCRLLRVAGLVEHKQECLDTVFVCFATILVAQPLYELS